MKAGIHPEYMVAKVTCACGRVTETRATVPELHVDICSHCHPFFTGRQKLVDTAGRVERFRAKYGNGDPAPRAGTAAEAGDATGAEGATGADGAPESESAPEPEVTPVAAAESEPVAQAEQDLSAEEAPSPAEGSESEDDKPAEQ